MRKSILENKKAAMEMSVGTIVTIVLLVSVLILGIFLIQRIKQTAINVIDLTDEQLIEEVNKLFAEDKKVVILPSTQIVSIKQEELGAVGVGIVNLVNANSFSYIVSALESPECDETPAQLEAWIVSRKTEGNIPIASGDSISRKIRFRIPVGSTLCLAGFRVDVYADEVAYGSEIFDIDVQAK